jgi:hypothetical protein
MARICVGQIAVVVVQSTGGGMSGDHRAGGQLQYMGDAAGTQV